MTRLFKGVILALLLCLSPLHASPTNAVGDADKVKLTADKLFFNEETRNMVAEGNVHLRYKDIEIETSSLKLNVDTNVSWGDGDVVFRRDEDEFSTTSFILDLDKEEVTLKELRVKVTPPEAKGDIFLSAKSITDTREVKTGKSGYVTACDNEKHHHFMWAQSFNYKPKKRIVLYNVLFYNEIFNIPIVLWSPVYWYALGERKVVWNFPTIGKKERDGWGYYIQNAFDYNTYGYGKDSSVYVDWFQTKTEGTVKREGNWGYGIKHFYEYDKLEGDIYYYNYDFKEIRRSGTGLTVEELTNKKIQMHNTYKPNDRLKLSYDFLIQDIDERINSTGQSELDNKDFKLNYDNLGDKHDLTFSEDQNFRAKQKMVDISYKRQFNSERRYDFHLRQTDLLASHKNILASEATIRKKLPGKVTIETTWDYDKNDFRNDDLDPEEKLVAQTTLTKTFTDNFNMKILHNQLYDLDSDTVTSDIQNNNYLYKVPEVQLNYTNSNMWDKKFSFTQNTIIGRYQEKRYDSQTQSMVTFPKTDDFTIAPNIFKFKQELSKSFTGKTKNYTKIKESNWSKHQNSLTLSAFYDQYLFQTPGYTFFESDALYFLGYSGTYSTDHFKHISTRTSYTSQSVGSNNFSPFLLYQKNGNPKNEISETLSFYHKNSRKQSHYEWENRISFNWMTNSWRKYTTTVTVKPSKVFMMTVSAGKLISPTPAQLPTRFDNTRLTMELLPQQSMKFDYNLSLDTNIWKDEDYIEVAQSNFNFKFRLGKLKLYQWHFEGNFIYNTSVQTDRDFNALRYQLQTFKLVKKAHRRTLEIGYNKVTNETTIKYSLNAFPDDPFEITKKENVWEVGGRFNKKSEERL